MTKALLAAHVVAAIIAIGPVTVAASMFPAAVRRADQASAAAESVAGVRLLHRICRVYATLGLAVPVFGLATASSLGVLTDAWLITSIVLTTAAAGILALLVLPRQDLLLTQIEQSHTTVDRHATARLGMLTGVFNMLWVIVTILMIIRPGSTTGA